MANWIRLLTLPDAPVPVPHILVDGFACVREASDTDPKRHGSLPFAVLEVTFFGAKWHSWYYYRDSTSSLGDSSGRTVIPKTSYRKADGSFPVAEYVKKAFKDAHMWSRLLAEFFPSTENGAKLRLCLVSPFTAVLIDRATSCLTNSRTYY
eukprot:scaffold84646_cov48-Prasinocladus_malaysianus.AAC.1